MSRLKGSTLTEEHKAKISKSNAGRKRTAEFCEFMRKKATGKKQTEQHILNRVQKLKGKKRTIEQRRKLSDLAKERVVLGKNPWGDGTKTPIRRAIYDSFEYKLWRSTVFERDNYTCVWCGQRGGTLNADHIKPFALFPELRFVVSNGRTLCLGCHRQTDTYGNRTTKLLAYYKTVRL